MPKAKTEQTEPKKKGMGYPLQDLDPSLEEEYGYRAEDESWMRAYSHAVSRGCTPKAGALYAEAHGTEEVFGGRGEE